MPIVVVGWKEKSLTFIVDSDHHDASDENVGTESKPLKTMKEAIRRISPVHPDDICVARFKRVK